jgi:putative PEP-CTERM system histidine kinase
VNSRSALPFAAAFFCALVVLAAVIRRRHSIASWSFAAGMATLAIESLLAGVGLNAGTLDEALHWQRLAFIAKSLLPGFWLCFSLTYSRGNYREFLTKWRLVLAIAFLLPLGVSVGFPSGVLSAAWADPDEVHWLAVGGAGRILIAMLLISAVLILTNLEKTFRSAVGTMLWRIKFMVVGVGVIFGARIYTGSQALIFLRHDPSLAIIETGALLVGCIFFGIAYLRTGFAESDVYPSRAVLQSSITVLVAGSYLFVVGVLAQIVAALGGGEYFQLQTLIVLLGIATLAAMLLSERFRQRLQRFISRHFKRPQHDFQNVWLLFTERIARVVDEAALSSAGAKFISETFHVLSVTIWLFDQQQQRLVFGASTSQLSQNQTVAEPLTTAESAATDGVRARSEPFDLEEINEPWAEALRQTNPTQFQHGGRRVAVPLVSGNQWLGVAILADRVSGVPYTVEEFELLKCIGDQLTASLLKVRLTGEIMRARELEAFQTVSAFFVHDLKNATSSLNLTLRNLPVHFDDAAFRQDALRAIAGTVERINSLTSKLSVLRGKLELNPVELDLNQLVNDTIADSNALVGMCIQTDFRPVPRITADRERLQSVLTNLLFNARDAVATGGQVTVRTHVSDGHVILSVRDTGCGMSGDFVRRQLFRPFQTTKKQGIGIGMFQTKAIVDAHGGTVQVESALGKGSTFRVALPITSRTA